jgi:hypothetical protein
MVETLTNLDNDKTPKLGENMLALSYVMLLFRNDCSIIPRAISGLTCWFGP